MVKIKTEINLAGIRMKNPVMTASGTFGYGKEYSQFFDLDKLGAIVPKTITLEPRQGNPTPRIYETPAGMLNSIGLENPGVEKWIEEALPFLRSYGVPVIANVSGSSIDDYVKTVRKLDKYKNWIAGYELNVSCPNVKMGMSSGKDPKATYDIISAVRKVTKQPLIVKLTPNVTDITKIAESAYNAKADALSMINTVEGMSIDAKTGKPKIHSNGRYIGGLSGPAIRPIGVACVYKVHKSGNPLPIVGIGGIETGEDAIEYIRAGATAVGVGCSIFGNPKAPIDVIKGIESFMKKNKIKDINDLVGKIKEI